VLDYLSGAKTHHPGHSYGVSDLDDVVEAHILAAENASTEGNFGN
jgi:hypothetical protein